MYCKILRKKNNQCIFNKIKVAKSFLSRLKGLIGVKELIEFEGLILIPCNSVHNFFMSFATDVVFLKKNGEVIHVIYDLKPWDLTRIVFQSHQVLEVKSGALPKDLAKGEFLEVVNV
jgi:uncharacterized membrane protein (UPF0127 family)